MTHLPYHIVPFIAVCLFTLGWAFCLPSTADAEEPARAPATSPRPVSEGRGLLRKGVDGDMCTLTFDDGPSRYTSELLNILKDYNIHATFFVVGTQVERHPELIRRMIEEGHEVGNHSYSHHELHKLGLKEQEADLRKLDVLLRKLGVTPRFIRPPYGFYDHNTVNAVQEMDGHIVMWSVDSQDWRKKDDLGDVLANMQTLYTGAPLRGVFLFHDTHRMTVESMPRILDALKANGCRFVTLSEYIDTPKVPSGQPVPNIQSAGKKKGSEPEPKEKNALPGKDAKPESRTAPDHDDSRTQHDAGGSNAAPSDSSRQNAVERAPDGYKPALSPSSSVTTERVLARIFDTMRLLPERHNNLPH